MVVPAVPVFDVGDTKFIGNHSSVSGTTAFKNSAGVAADPTEVELRLKLPDGTAEVYRWPSPAPGETALSREAVGRFYTSKTFALEGPYGWRETGTGVIAETVQGRFYVRVSYA